MQVACLGLLLFHLGVWIPYCCDTELPTYDIIRLLSLRSLTPTLLCYLSDTLTLLCYLFDIPDSYNVFKLSMSC
jgi:hypothetical protein